MALSSLHNNVTITTIHLQNFSITWNRNTVLSTEQWSPIPLSSPLPGPNDFLKVTVFRSKCSPVQNLCAALDRRERRKSFSKICCVGKFVSGPIQFNEGVFLEYQALCYEELEGRTSQPSWSLRSVGATDTYPHQAVHPESCASDRMSWEDVWTGPRRGSQSLLVSDCLSCRCFLIEESFP